MRLVRILAILRLDQARIPLGLEVDNNRLLRLVAPDSHRVDPDPLDGELVLAKDIVQRVERLGTVDVKVEDVAEDLFEGVVREALEVADEGEEFAQGEGVGKGAGLRTR